MADVDRKRAVATGLLFVTVLLVIGTLLEDPIGVGSTDFYTLTGMGLGFAAWRGLEVKGSRPAVFVGIAAAAGGLLMGIGSLPLSHPIADPWVVQGRTISTGGLLSVVGLVLFVSSLGSPEFLSWAADPE